jgi:hypothetical protein
MSGFAHEASIEIAVPAEAAFAYIADGMKQGEWALGSWNRRPAAGGVFVGTSLFDGSQLSIRLTAHPELMLVVYDTGGSADDLRPMVWGRVVPGPVLGLADGHCVVTFTIWRGASMDAATWELMSHTFPTELRMIKGRLELGF